MNSFLQNQFLGFRRKAHRNQPLSVTMSNDNDSDMFTKLTDYMLYIIISLLPFKEAARTSILSKRWRHLWRATKSIEFDESFFVKANESQEEQEIQRRFFVDFARQWIENYREPVINKFQLIFSNPGNFRVDVERYISFAIRHNVKVFGLDFSDPTWEEDNLENHAALFDLPSNVYEHGVVESLKLFSCSFRMPQFMNFGALKDLSLGWIELRFSFIEALLGNCRLLESLSLKKCWNIENLHVSGPNLRLKSLVVDKCDFLQHWFGIEAPNLRFLKYSGTVGIFEVEITRCMEEADLDFGLEFEFDDEAGYLLYKLLEGLYPIKVLTVCSYMLQHIPLGDEPLRMSFPLNIKHLILKTALHENEFYGITFFLHSCPSLETLTIDMMSPGRIFPDYRPPFTLNPAEFWMQHTMEIICLSKTLKVVEVKGFKGTRNEVCLLCYMLFFGRVLEKMNITISNEADANGENVDVYRQRARGLQTFPKTSQILQISIY